MSDNADDGIPFYLMPVAAVVGSYALFGGLRILQLVYAHFTKKEGDASKTTLSSFAGLVVTVVGSMFGYAYIVAQVNTAMLENEYALFDPYDILGLPDLANNATEIKQAYRNLSKQHHPDKGGSDEMFQKIHTAYRALTSDKDNYDAHGHPDGPLSTQMLAFALPQWLLHPEGNVAIVLIVLYLALFGFIIYIAISWTKQGDSAAARAAKKADDMSVAGQDTQYLADILGPESTHMDVLLAIATTPENVALTENSLEKIQELKDKRLKKEKDKAPKKAASNQDLFDLDSGDWEEDDEDDEDAKKAKEEEAAKKKALQQLAEATGAMDILMEGMDDGVLGQTWVEKTLQAGGHWPPKDLRFLSKKTFAYKNAKSLSALEHPAVRRNLCFTMGRINSMLLNTHTDLLEASSKKLIDQTYFKGSMDYRQRAGLMLEAALRIAVTMKSYRLAKTIIETVSMFKIGVEEPTSPKTLAWFKTVMTKQYSPAGLPGLNISDLKVETPGEDEIATGDLCAITLTMERVHAEAFTKVKVAQCQKQGIPPQIALSTYREGWWVLVRAQKQGGTAAPNESVPENPLTKLLQGTDLSKFDKEQGEKRLLVAWPMIVQNMAQKSGKVKIQFKAPSTPGKYKIILGVQSQEFLGTDQEFELPVTILDAETVKNREEKGDEEEEEAKKEK